MAATPVHGPPFGPPPKRTRWGLIVGVIAGNLVLLCCCGGAVLFGLIASQYKPADAAAESYVDAVIADDDAKALQYVCTTSGSEASHDSFKAYVRSKGVSDGRVVNTQVALRGLSWNATVRMELTVSTGGRERLELPMAKQGGKWKVCN